MIFDDWMSLAACAGILPLVALSILHRGRSPMAVPVALFGFNLFVWNFATWAYRYSHEAAWLLLDGSFSAFMPPLALHAVLVFVGRKRSLRPLLVASYLAFAPVSAWAVAIVATRGAEYWLAEGQWSLTLLALWLPLFVIEIVLLVRHLRRASTHGEQMRTRWFLASVLVGGSVGSTELYDHLLAVPALGHVAALLSAIMLTMIATRWRLFGLELTSRVALYALALAAFGVVGYLGVFRVLQANNALLVIGTASITLVLFGAVGDVVLSAVAQQERLRRLAALGRFSAQMAHDLKNPLASLKGALQFLAEERAQGRTLDDQREFFELMEEQVDRVERTVLRYERMSAVEPMLGEVQLNDLVAQLLGSAALLGNANAAVSIRTELAADLPSCRADRDLLLSAIANVVRNGIEAMANAGTLVVRTGLDDGGDGGACVRLSVQDDGRGMDVRELERAVEDFYTTKSRGSGLGLAFVRRVVEAHEGTLELASDPAHGTLVTLRIPVAGPTRGHRNS